MRIKVTKLSEPTSKAIRIKCPGCGVPISRYVPINRKGDNDSCGICGTAFGWEEVK